LPMEITTTFYAEDRNAWRQWLAENHKTATEIWLVSYKKHTGKPNVSYNDAVEEALCFGWIDGINKRLDEDRTAQRYTPRRPKSNWSELNKERARKLIAIGSMTEAGQAVLCDLSTDNFTIAKDVVAALKAEPQAWENFQQFPDSYQRIRIGFIEASRDRPEIFSQRLAYFVKMTAQNKQFGTRP
jgi:uncharacterized protein YdeI (YjbR/CyaY-like superfamily)